MSRYIYYISVLFFLMICSCQKPDTDASDGVFSGGGLMTFSTNVETKAPIITDLSGKDIGVYGYGFSKNTNWNTVKAKGTPNIFHNQQVSCGEGGMCDYTFTPIIVKNAQGVDQVLEYGSLIQNKWREWDLNHRYSFFAYYPYAPLSGNPKPSGSQVLNIPYVEYTLPVSTSGTNNPDDMLDIMTAQRTDYAATQGTSVRFAFYHRLFCIDLYAHNFTSDPITVTNLTVEISGIQYNKTQIYLDRDRLVFDEALNQDVPQSSVPSAQSWNTSNKVTFRIMEQNFSGITIASNENKSLSFYAPENAQAGYDKNIMLIPQNAPLKVKLRFYKNGVLKTPEGTFEADFQEGKKYALTVNFVDDEVSLVTGSAVPWEHTEITHTFD